MIFIDHVHQAWEVLLMSTSLLVILQLFLLQLFNNVVFHCYRGGAEDGYQCVSPLPGRRVTLGHHRHSLHHEAQSPHHGGSLQVREERQTHHLS